MNRQSLAGVMVMVICGLLVLRHLSWSVSPNFFFMESYSIAYHLTAKLSDMCSRNPFQGLEASSPNVTDHLSTSILFTTPTRLLRGWVDLYTVQRTVQGLFYAGTVAGFLVLFRLWRVPVLMSASLVLFYCLSSPLTSLLLQFKLTLSSVCWLVWALVFIEIMVRRSREKDASALRYIFIFPTVCAVSYETYAVARVLGLGLFGMGGLWILAAVRSGTVNRSALVSFGCGTLFALALLKGAHPEMHFDLRLFEGRTESVIDSEGRIKPETKSILLERLQELPVVFRRAWLHEPSSEQAHTAGWLEVIVILVSLSTLFLFPRVRSNGPLRAYLRERAPIPLLLAVLAAVSLFVPLASRTMIRGHRLFGFYPVTVLMIAILGTALWYSGKRWAKIAVGVSCVALTTLTVGVSVPSLVSWSPEPHLTPSYAWELLRDLPGAVATYGLTEGGTEESSIMVVCDRKEPPDWAHFWNAALYVSSAACELGIENILLRCPCSAENPRESLCLERVVSDGVQRLEIRSLR
jgi:hypothetical protein